MATDAPCNKNMIAAVVLSGGGQRGEKPAGIFLGDKPKQNSGKAIFNSSAIMLSFPRCVTPSPELNPGCVAFNTHAFSLLSLLSCHEIDFPLENFIFLSECLCWLRSDSGLDRYLWWLLPRPLMGSW